MTCQSRRFLSLSARALFGLIIICSCADPTYQDPAMAGAVAAKKAEAARAEKEARAQKMGLATTEEQPASAMFVTRPAQATPIAEWPAIEKLPLKLDEESWQRLLRDSDDSWEALPSSSKTPELNATFARNRQSTERSLEKFASYFQESGDYPTASLDMPSAVGENLYDRTEGTRNYWTVRSGLIVKDWRDENQSITVIRGNAEILIMDTATGYNAFDSMNELFGVNPNVALLEEADRQRDKLDSLRAEYVTYLSGKEAIAEPKVEVAAQPTPTKTPVPFDQEAFDEKVRRLEKVIADMEQSDPENPKLPDLRQRLEQVKAGRPASE